MSRPPVERDLIERLARVGDVHEAGPLGRSELLESLHLAEAILGHIEADEAFFEAAPKLRILATVSVGFNHIDIEAATRRGVLVCHTPGVLNRAVVDITMSLIFSLSLRLRENEAYVRSGGWSDPNVAPPALGNDIRGKTLGVIGFGRIGQDVTRRMQYLGMRTLWHDRYTGPFEDAPDSQYRELDQLLAESDVVSLHTNWEPGSPALLGHREISLMKSSALLVNTARGPLIDQDALAEALASGAIAGAGLDVLREEPPEAGERIVSLPNVVCYPHIGSATEETRRAMRELAVANIIAFLDGDEVPSAVNADSLN